MKIKLTKKDIEKLDGISIVFNKPDPAGPFRKFIQDHCDDEDEDEDEDDDFDCPEDGEGNSIPCKKCPHYDKCEMSSPSLKFNDDDCDHSCNTCVHNDECESAEFDCPDDIDGCEECVFVDVCKDADIPTKENPGDSIDKSYLYRAFMKYYLGKEEYLSEAERAEIDLDYRFFNALYADRELLRKVRKLALEKSIVDCKMCSMYEECLDEGPKCRSMEEKTVDRHKVTED